MLKTLLKVAPPAKFAANKVNSSHSVNPWVRCVSVNVYLMLAVSLFDFDFQHSVLIKTVRWARQQSKIASAAIAMNMMEKRCSPVRISMMGRMGASQNALRRMRKGTVSPSLVK